MKERDRMPYTNQGWKGQREKRRRLTSYLEGGQGDPILDQATRIRHRFTRLRNLGRRARISAQLPLKRHRPLQRAPTWRQGADRCAHSSLSP